MIAHDCRIWVGYARLRSDGTCSHQTAWTEVLPHWSHLPQGFLVEDNLDKVLVEKLLFYKKPLEIISPVKLIPTSPLSTTSTSPLFNNCNRYLSIPFFLPKSCFLSPSLSWIYFSSSFYQSEVVFPPPPYSFKTTGCKTQCRPLSTIRNKTDAQK